MHNILVIEPDKDFCNNLTELLEMEGYNVHSTISIPKIRSELRDENTEVIILDEFSLKGTYNLLEGDLKKNRAKHLLIVLNAEGRNSDFEYADNCLSMPFSGESLTNLLNSKLKY